MPKTISVRKFRVCQALSPEAFKRLTDELTIQHRNKNKHIHIDRERRKLIREVQSKHPLIGTITDAYANIEAERELVIKAIEKRYAKDLRVINAKIADAAKVKDPTMPLVKERKRIEARKKADIKEETESHNLQLKHLAVSLRNVKSFTSKKTVEIRKDLAPLREEISRKLAMMKTLEKRSQKYLELKAEVAELREAADSVKAKAAEHDIYAPVTAHVNELKKLACQDLSPAEAAKYGFRFGEAGHSGTKWWIKKHRDQAAEKRSKDMSPEGDPKFLIFQPAYLSDEIREGTLCAGINQARAANAGPLSFYNSETKGLLYIKQAPANSVYDRRFTSRKKREKLCKTEVWFRIGSKQEVDPETGRIKRRPEWLKLHDVAFHHRIPDGAVITEALLKLEAVGALKHLYLILTIEHDPEPPIIPKTMDSVTIRRHTQVGDGALVFATMETEGGEKKPLYFGTDPRRLVRHWSYPIPRSSGVRRDPHGVLRHFKNGKWSTSTKELSDMFTYVEGLERTQRVWFKNVPFHEDHAKSGGSRLSTVVLGYIASTDDERLPACLADAKAHNIFQWKSTGRLQRLLAKWREQRVRGDEEAFEAMDEWAKQDLHLYQWARNMTHRITGRKLDTFRKHALDLCRTYKTIYVDDVETNERLPGVTQEHATARTKWSRRAGFGLFREVLRKTAARCGTEVVAVSFKEESAAEAAE